jgi:signal transduction histidine kinase
VAGSVKIKALAERLLLNAPPWRAWLEMLGVGFALLLGVSLVAASITAGDRQNGMFIAILSGVTLYALRLRLPRGSWRRQILSETVVGLGLALVLAGLLLALGLGLLSDVVHAPDQAGLMAITVGVLGLQDTLVERQTQGVLGPWLTFVVLLSCLIAFSVSRAASRLWLFWNRLRHRRLIWALTHSHLMLVTTGVALWAGFIFLTYLRYALDRNVAPSAPVNALFGVVPLAIVMLIFVAVVLAIVLPPATILSYFAARRTTRRLQALITATGALRSGDYGARVDVAGEDEVAQLQADFNAMSAALQAAMQDLQTERDAVAALLRSRRELVASVSHELRTPVAIVRSHLEAMLSRWETSLPPALQRDVELIDQETAHLQRLLDDLFTLSRAEVGELDLRLLPTDVVAVARRCVAAAAPVLWQSSKVELVADAPDALPPALADEMRLEQIIHNLLRNAARHTPPGGIVAVSARAEPDALVLQVRDTGEGIAPQDLPHIWERFYRSETTRARDSSGAGLGLALVKELTEAMNGTVQAASTPAHGSCFTIRLPRA